VNVNTSIKIEEIREDEVNENLVANYNPISKRIEEESKHFSPKQ
jgi:hypothetical protein